MRKETDAQHQKRINKEMRDCVKRAKAGINDITFDKIVDVKSNDGSLDDDLVTDATNYIKGKYFSPQLSMFMTLEEIEIFKRLNPGCSVTILGEQDE